jgi:putative PEP-CTERM system histidine kinase
MPGLVVGIVCLLSFVLDLMNLERTFRASVGTMRWRIKFMLIGLAVLFVVRAYTTSQFILFHKLDLALQALDHAALIVACLLISRSLLRTGHFEVNVFPSRFVLQNSLTLLVAGVYLVVVGLLAKLVSYLGADTSFELKAFIVLIALVFLALLLASDRVRLHTKRFVSRHFQRPVHDYRAVWRTFTEGTATRVEQRELCDAVVRLISDIFQALSVSMWLLDERRQTSILAASTSLSSAASAHLALDIVTTSSVINAMSQRPDPIDIDASEEDWASALRRTNPEEFRKGGNRVCAPLIAGGDLLGLVVVGDRVGAVPFSFQDFDLLKSVSDQAAACLLNIQLSQRLAQAKQLEAFQAMSAFFVHDLKNTASTLSLMLQNLPVHYEDPQFREDALRGISKTVAHINELIGRLTVLRQELAVHPVECDLNQLIEDTLKGQEPPGISLVKELKPLPRLRLDPQQIQKVITNLVLNAQEAIRKGGRIVIETARHNGWAVLSVSDDGCGMSAEFIQKSLFRPFRTTKQKGLGIGMFHCKMIIEAHQGRIEVESQPGHGTAFKVLLPLMEKE